MGTGSFPSEINGDYGDEKVAQSTKIGGLPLGILMKLPDGRKFRHAQASATAMVAGQLYEQNTPAAIAGSAMVTYLTGMAVRTTVAAGSNTIEVTTGGTAVMTADQLADGYLYVSSTIGTAGGHTYKIKSHPAAASASAMKITLADNDILKVGLAAGTTTVGVRHNEYKNLTLATGSTATTGHVAGIPPVNVTGSHYCWIQRSGMCSALTEGDLIANSACVASTITGGQVGPMVTSTTTVAKDTLPVGRVVSVSASLQHSLITLMLE